MNLNLERRLTEFEGMPWSYAAQLPPAGGSTEIGVEIVNSHNVVV